jgi:hypothetical protein
VQDTEHRKCICNALLSVIGQPQVRGNYEEPAVVTAGDDLAGIGRFLAPGESSYRAADVIARLLDSADVQAPDQVTI